MADLKLCPFCGCGEGNLYIVTFEQHGYETLGIFCNGCKQTVHLEENEWEGDTVPCRMKAIEAWNRRAEPWRGEEPWNYLMKTTAMSVKVTAMTII